MVSFFGESAILCLSFCDKIFYLDTILPASRPPLSRYQSSDRWTVPVSLPVQYHNAQNYQVSFSVSNIIDFS